MIKEEIKYLQDTLISPKDRFVEIVDEDGLDRHFVIDDEGSAREIKSSIKTAHLPLEINTLTGLIDYVKAKLERPNDLYLHVKDEQTVTLKGLLNKDGEREELVIAHAIVPHFHYQHFHDAEELIIALQSNFVQAGDRDLLLKVIGNVKEENVRSTGDDGMSQAVTIQTGLSNVDDVKVPNPVTLAPYRTFLEVEQPESEFVFRMKDGPRAGIFEADGGAWRNEAIANVRDFLLVALSEEVENGSITIIA